MKELVSPEIDRLIEEKTRELWWVPDLKEMIMENVKAKMEDLPKYPLAFLPPQDFPRMFSQQSAFTIHPDSGEGNNIEDILKDKSELIRYIIPKRYKRELCRT